MAFFNVEEYCKQEDAIKKAALSGDEDALDDLSTLKDAGKTFSEYVYKVAEERLEVRAALGVLKGDEYRNVAEHFDGTRHTAHEKAIVNTNMLNRIAAVYGCGSVFTGDTGNRREIGEFCCEFTSWLFSIRYE